MKKPVDDRAILMFVETLLEAVSEIIDLYSCDYTWDEALAMASEEIVERRVGRDYDSS